MTPRELSLLLELLHYPTAPFREQRVVEFVRHTLHQHRVAHFLDPIGNIVVGCGSRREYAQLLSARTRDPVRLFIAHMDHPGFHGVRWRAANRLQVQWHGGGPTRHLTGAPV